MIKVNENISEKNVLSTLDFLHAEQYELGWETTLNDLLNQLTLDEMIAKISTGPYAGNSLLWIATANAACDFNELVNLRFLEQVIGKWHKDTPLSAWLETAVEGEELGKSAFWWLNLLARRGNPGLLNAVMHMYDIPLEAWYAQAQTGPNQGISSLWLQTSAYTSGDAHANVLLDVWQKFSLAPWFVAAQGPHDRGITPLWNLCLAAFRGRSHLLLAFYEKFHRDIPFSAWMALNTTEIETPRQSVSVTWLLMNAALAEQPGCQVLVEKILATVPYVFGELALKRMPAKFVNVQTLLDQNTSAWSEKIKKTLNARNDFFRHFVYFQNISSTLYFDHMSSNQRPNYCDFRGIIESAQAAEQAGYSNVLLFLEKAFKEKLYIFSKVKHDEPSKSLYYIFCFSRLSRDFDTLILERQFKNIQLNTIQSSESKPVVESSKSILTAFDSSKSTTTHEGSTSGEDNTPVSDQESAKKLKDNQKKTSKFFQPLNYFFK